MNQNLNSNNFSKQINDEKLKSLFIPSSYYEKDIYDNNSNNIGSMPTQYYNFQPTQYLANDSKEKAKKIIHSTKNANPLNITNNINISNYSFNETQKQETNYQPHLNFEEQTNLRNDCQKKCRKKKKNIQNMNISQRQQLYSFHNPNSNFKSNFIFIFLIIV